MLNDCAQEPLPLPALQHSAAETALPVDGRSGRPDAGRQASARELRNRYRQSCLRTAADSSTGSSSAARLIGTTEGELVAAHCGVFAPGESPMKSRRLQAPWPEIVRAMEDLGEVACIIGHDDCALTRIGPCTTGSSLDLRYDLWCHGFAVEERQTDGCQARSLQFYCRDGRAIIKFVLTARSQPCAFFDLVEDFGTHELLAGIVIEGTGAEPAWPQCTDTAPLRQAWASLRSADAVALLFKRLGVSELQAVQGLASDYASPLPVESAQELLARAAQAGLAVTASAGVGGASLCWTGEFKRIHVVGAKVTASAPGILLNWHEDRLACAWLVKTPTSVGLGHSLVLFDGEGRFVLRIEGERHPGRPEHCQWRELLCSLSEERVPCRC